MLISNMLNHATNNTTSDHFVLYLQTYPKINKLLYKSEKNIFFIYQKAYIFNLKITNFAYKSKIQL